MRDEIRETLRVRGKATAREIAEACGLSPILVGVQCGKMYKNGELDRCMKFGYGATGRWRTYTYWLAEDPEGVN